MSRVLRNQFVTFYYSVLHVLHFRPEPGQEPVKFIMHQWLENDETETEFLRTVADVLLIHLLPDEYAKVQSVRHLLREILACAGIAMKPHVQTQCAHSLYVNA